MKISILPQNLVNKIAAGEVIERPASVVKELVENSIDGGATTVDLQVERAGTQLIRVTDDGGGLDAAELPLAFLSHATSKLANEEDLFNIRTLGFRGEALPSIASVARVRMMSRARGAAEGAEIVVEGGTIQHTRACGTPEGTTIEVSDLFFNLPVRRKFLKSLATEMSHVTEAITRIALAHPEVHFTLTHNGKQVFNLPPSSDRAERIGTFFGTEIADNLISVSSQHPLLTIEGHITQPSVTRANSRTQYYFLNGRHIRDTSINHAIMMAYQSLLPQRKFPAVFLWLRLEAGQVDVNVHPTKIEVRFRQSQLIHDLVYRALREALRQAHAIPSPFSKPPQPPAEAEAGEGESHPSIRQAISDFFVEGATPRQEPRERQWRPTTPTQAQASSSPPLPHQVDEPTAPAQAAPATDAPAPQPMFEGTGERSHTFIQMLDSYILEETRDGVLFTDQHALHERILYERIKRQLESATITSQRLLIPELVELPAGDFFKIMALKEGLGRLGLELDEFGERTLIVRAVPQIFRNFKAREFFDELLGELADSPAENATARLDALARIMACKAAVKAGQRLSAAQIRELLAMRDRMPGVTTCPHGRPVSFHITDKELETKFKRR